MEILFLIIFVLFIPIDAYLVMWLFGFWRKPAVNKENSGLVFKRVVLAFILGFTLFGLGIKYPPVLTALVNLNVASVLWFVLTKIFKRANVYIIATGIFLLTIPGIYTSTLRITQYRMAQTFLETANSQSIELRGRSITIQEENALKEELKISVDFLKASREDAVNATATAAIALPIVLLLAIDDRKKRAKIKS